MKTFTFRATDCVADSIEAAAKSAGIAAEAWIERTVAHQAFLAWEKEAQRRRAADRARGRIIPFPGRTA